MILLGFLYNALQVEVDAPHFAAGFIPGFAGTESVLLATGIVGATVMPHAIYLHSALTQRRVAFPNDDERRQSCVSTASTCSWRWASPEW